MDQKGIAPLVIVIIVVVAAAGAGAAYVLTSGGGGGNGGGTGGGDIGSATSLDFKVDMDIESMETVMRYRAKDIGTSDLKVRIDATVEIMGESAETITILDSEAGSAWMWMAGIDWIEMPIGDFDVTEFDSFTGELSGWTSGDYTYTDPTTGASIRIYDVQVNPSLSDSLFQHS